MDNKIKFEKLNISDVFSVLAIATLTFCSGGNPHIQRIIFLIMSTVLLFLAINRVRVKNIVIFVLIAGYILLNSMILNTAPTDAKECAVMVIRLACCAVIASCMSMDKFKKLFLKLMVFLSVLSLICFACMTLKIPLPFVTLKKGIYGAFYHTLSIGTGWNLERNRNSGVFSEPGIFQIYLNIALLIVLSYRSMPLKKSKAVFWLFSITMLTTKSSMGILLWLVVLVLFYIERREILPNFGIIRKRYRILIVIAAGGLILLEELLLGKGMHFIQNVNSWASRHDDTILTFLTARDYPWFGIGLMTDPIPLWNVYYERYASLRLYTEYQYARSNGLGNFLAGAGIPFTLLYLWCIIKAYFKMSDIHKLISRVILALLIIGFFMEEPIMTTPFFLISFFMWAEEQENLNKQVDMKVITKKAA